MEPKLMIKNNEVMQMRKFNQDRLKAKYFDLRGSCSPKRIFISQKLVPKNFKEVNDQDLPQFTD